MGRLGRIGARITRASIWPLILFAASFPLQTAVAQSDQGPSVVMDPAAAASPTLDPVDDRSEGTSQSVGRSVTPIFAPIPFKNTQVGWGLMLLGGLIHRFGSDTTAKPSTGLAGGFYTENGSWGLMAVENAKLGGDSWRLRALLGHMEIRYDFYGIGQAAGDAGQSIGLQQNMNMVMAAGLRRVAHGVYLGVTGLWMDASISLRDTTGQGPLPVPVPADTARLGLFAWGLQGEVDTRNNDYWPARGAFGELRAFFFTDALGGSRTFQRYRLSATSYTPVRGEQLVLATNVILCGAKGGAPFWTMCSIGSGRGGLRGYTQGRYRDSVLTTVQTELRYHSSGRFGATAFGGFGQVAPSAGDIFDAEVLFAGGLGVRYQLIRRYPVHMRFDYAWGRDGGLFYFAVAEAF
jgi:Omp85 superfamily domain